MKWWYLLNALRFIVLGSGLLVVGAFLSYVAWQANNTEILGLGGVVVVMGLAMQVLVDSRRGSFRN